jgi:ribonucleoside-diphosphate reductase alpha chain
MSVKRERPRVLRNITYQQATPSGQNVFITIGVDENGQPFEVFINYGRCGSDSAADLEALGRAISFALRLESSLPPIGRLRELADQFRHIGGGASIGFGNERVVSVPDAVAKVLEEFIAEDGDGLLGG